MVESRLLARKRPRQRKTRWSLPSGAVMHAYRSEQIFVTERL